MTTRTDTGSLRRGTLLLKLLASGGSRGCPLTELSERSGMPHPSVHRILGQLIAEGLVEHQRDTHRYKLGPLTFELGIASSTMYDIRDLCEAAMQQLAQHTGDTVYLVIRSGFDAVCLHRVEGNYPIRALVLEVGSRRPLGVGAGGLAILAAIDEAARREIVDRVAPALPAFGKLTRQAVLQSCEQAREAGVAVIQNRVNLGVTAAGVHFCDTMGQPIGAISVAALTQRMGAQRLRGISTQLRAAAADIERQLRLRQRHPARKKPAGASDPGAGA